MFFSIGLLASIYPRTSRTGYYGQGTYFASQACKNHQYAAGDDDYDLHTIIVCRVALGDVFYADKVDKDCRRPPLNADTVFLVAELNCRGKDVFFVKRGF